MNNEGTCDHCAWWGDLGDDNGQCRRYAPRPRTSTDQVVWPITEAHEFCGEFEDDTPWCDCAADEMCAICGADDTDDEFDAIIADLLDPPTHRWWARWRK